MKKLINKKFILILVSTITLLVVLSTAMIFLTKENTKSFKKSGYIIASGKADDSIKYYFDEGTTYKTNVNSELVFKDSTGEKVNVETANFLHYTDGGIKFLKNGVIMDLESVNSTIVPYYNITNKSILEYSKKSYYIEAIDKTLAFNNIVGRISENKYIFAGTNISLQLAGSSESVKGDYFEITYIKDGIIRVENQESSYQTTAENSYVLVNDNIKIDLGTKNVYYENEEKMSLSQMTIDGNENIEIISIDKEDNGNKNDNNNPTPTPSPSPTTSPSDNTSGNGENNQNPNNNPDGNGNQGGDGNETIKKSASIELIKAEVGVNSINASFKINDEDNTIKGNLVLSIVNTDTGKRVYGISIGKDQKTVDIDVISLSPESNYILSISEENDGAYDTQYYQKLFKTNELGITLEKKYVTSSSLAYNVVFDNNTPVRSAKISLYDENYELVKEPIVVNKENSVALFEELKNNTSYNVVLDDVILDNLEYNKVYSINKTTKTLKILPYLEGLTTEVNEEDSSFTIGIKTILDEDSSITKYTYYIYKADDITEDNIDTLTPVETIEKDNSAKVKVSVNNKIESKKNYRFKVVAEYYDNEKYGEFETELSDNFILTGKPTVEFIPDTTKTEFNRIVGKVIIKDENCTVPISGRECSSIVGYKNNFSIDYWEVNKPTEAKTLKNINFNLVHSEEYKADVLESELDIDSLTAKTEYIFNVYGDVDLLDGRGIRKGYFIGTFRASTSNIDILTVDTWEQNASSFEDLINVTAKISSTNELMANSMKNMTINLYANDVLSELNSGTVLMPIATKKISGNLKEDYYNQRFTINTLDTFGIKDTEIENEDGTSSIMKAIEVLKNKTDGKLLKYYTIEITDVYDDNYQNKILIEKNRFVFKTPALILLEDQLASPTITADEILKENLNSIDSPSEIKSYNSDLKNDTIVGYKVNVSASIDKISTYFEGANPVKELIIYACDSDIDENCTVDNAIDKQIINLAETSDLETIFYLKKGTKLGVTDNELTRGHNYVFKAKFNIDTNDDGVVDSLYPSNEVKTKNNSAIKESPSYRIIPQKTTANTITYTYTVKDIDNALYDNKFYYTVDNTLKNPDSEIITNEIELNNNEFTLENLEIDSVYSISFKKALIKKEIEVQDVEIGKYIFDGKFTYSANTVSYQLVTNDNDNRLRIIILEDENNQKYVDRISAYNLVLSAPSSTDYTKVYPSNKLSSCKIEEKDYKCIIVDYANIKDFKTKNISVKLTAYYDTGIINNDFTNLPKDGIGYLLQTNNTYNGNLSRADYYYFTYNAAGNIIIDTIKTPIGIIDYGKNSKTSAGYNLQIKQKIDANNFEFSDSKISNLVLSSGGEGYYIVDRSGTAKTINNKLLDKIDMYTSNNTFKFNSIIPKIEVSSTGLVNGATVTIKPIGIDTDILNNEFGKDSDGKYYFYLTIYKDSDKSEIYKEEKVEINIDGSTIELTKYMPDTTYYFEVSALMKKNNEYKKTLLFDANNTKDYVSSLYSFSSLTSEEINRYSNVSVTHKTEDGIYAKRTMKMTMDSSNTIGTYDVRFELYDGENNLIFSGKAKDSANGGTFGPKDQSTFENRATLTKDISNMDLIYGSKYYIMKIYIETEVSEGTGIAELLVEEKQIDLTRLSDPEITANRASYEVDSLLFRVSIKDSSKVIKDGKYCVELLNSANKPIEGYPTKCGIDVVDKEGRELKNIEYKYEGLTPDTLYIFRVYADVYTNNMGEKNKERVIENRQTISTSTSYGVALGSVAAYGSKSSVTLSYSSGVNIRGIKKIEYTLMERNAGEIASDTYYMDVADSNHNKDFEVSGDAIKLVINPEGLTLQSNKSYYLVMSYYVEKDGKLVLLNNRNYEQSIEF